MGRCVFQAGSFLAVERLNLNSAGCNPVFHSDYSSTTTEWLNKLELNNMLKNNSTTKVVDETTIHFTTGFHPALFMLKHSVLKNNI